MGFPVASAWVKRGSGSKLRLGLVGPGEWENLGVILKKKLLPGKGVRVGFCD